MPQPSTPVASAVASSAGERRERPERRLLGGMVRLLVAGDVPAVVDAGGEEAGVVARAVVPRLERGVAAQVLLGEAEVGEHAPHEVRLEVQALVRGAHDGELLGAPAEVLDGAVRQPRLRLERLGRRPPVRHHARVAPALDDLAVGAGERGAGAVQALDGPAAAGLDEDLGVLDGLGHGAAPRDDCGRVYSRCACGAPRSTPLRGQSGTIGACSTATSDRSTSSPRPSASAPCACRCSPTTTASPTSSASTTPWPRRCSTTPSTAA